MLERVLIASPLATSTVQFVEGGRTVAAVGAIALVSTAISLRLRFRGEWLFGTRVTTFYTLLLIWVSTGTAMGVAAVRPLGLAFLGVATPVPLRRQENRDSESTMSSLTTVLGLIADKLSHELGALKMTVCQPMVSALRDGTTSSDEFANALKERVFYRPIPEGEKTKRYGEVKAALDRCGKDPVLGPTALVKLAYEWNFRDLLSPSQEFEEPTEPQAG